MKPVSAADKSAAMRELQSLWPWLAGTLVLVVGVAGSIWLPPSSPAPSTKQKIARMQPQVAVLAPDLVPPVGDAKPETGLPLEPDPSPTAIAVYDD